MAPGTVKWLRLRRALGFITPMAAARTCSALPRSRVRDSQKPEGKTRRFVRITRGERRQVDEHQAALRSASAVKKRPACGPFFQFVGPRKRAFLPLARLFTLFARAGSRQKPVKSWAGIRLRRSRSTAVVANGCLAREAPHVVGSTPSAIPLRSRLWTSEDDRRREHAFAGSTAPP